MAKNDIFEILRDIYEGNSMIFHEREEKKKKKRHTKTELHKTPDAPVRTVINPAFLYIKLQHISNLPQSSNKMEIQLTHATHLVSKISEKYDQTNSFDVAAPEKPTFTMTIETDSVAEMTNFSDNPLTITLYERQRMYDAEEEEEHIADSEQTQEGELKPIAVGFIDLLECFCNKRVGSEVTSFLYVTEKDNPNRIAATKTIWSIYTLLPLLKHTTFCNLIFVTLESIYNPPLELLEQYEHVTVKVWIRFKIPQEDGAPTQLLVCDYCTATKQIVAEQQTTHRWENLQQGHANRSGLSTCTDTKVNRNELFQELLGTDGVNFRYNEVNVNEDESLAFYSMHRFVLTEPTSAMLHEAIAYNQYELFIEVINRETDKTVMTGTLDPAVFLYPNVNSCRFAVELKPTDEPTKSKIKAPAPSKGKKTKPDSKAPSNRTFVPPKPTFAVFHICLLTPITAPIVSINLLNPNPLNRKVLKTCTKIEVVPAYRSISEFCGLSYKAVDDLVASLARYIMTNEITETTNHKRFFCCQLKNLQANVQKIIACDFNRRIPTKSNMEFRNLMTVVYQELEKRMYDFMQRCALEGMSKCLFSLSDEENRVQIINTMNEAKVLQEVGNEAGAKFLFDKIYQKYPNDRSVYFYMYLYQIERQDFEASKEYIDRPVWERFGPGEYYRELLTIYVAYVQNLQNLETVDKALEKLLSALTAFSEQNPQDIDGWLLLYCLYSNTQYLPGMEYTRWKFENLYEKPVRVMPLLPLTRWQILFNYQLQMKTQKGFHFYMAVERFVNFGMYYFAETIFNSIAKEFTDIERYLMTNTFKILKNQVEPKLAIKNFATEKMLNGQVLKAFQYQINGSLDFIRRKEDAAMQSYGNILRTYVTSFKDYQLGLLRYAFHMMDTEQYEQAVEAFEKFQEQSAFAMLSNINLGKAMYKLNRYEEAIEWFAKSTRYQTHIPDVWAYLALIHLKLGHNHKALICWRYAKLNPKNVVSDEILEELKKINIDDVCLYVDLVKREHIIV